MACVFFQIRCGICYITHCVLKFIFGHCDGRKIDGRSFMLSTLCRNSQMLKHSLRNIRLRTRGRRNAWWWSRWLRNWFWSNLENAHLFSLRRIWDIEFVGRLPADFIWFLHFDDWLVYLISTRLPVVLLRVMMISCDSSCDFSVVFRLFCQKLFITGNQSIKNNIASVCCFLTTTGTQTTLSRILWVKMTTDMTPLMPSTEEEPEALVLILSLLVLKSS